MRLISDHTMSSAYSTCCRLGSEKVWTKAKRRCYSKVSTQVLDAVICYSLELSRQVRHITLAQGSRLDPSLAMLGEFCKGLLQPSTQLLCERTLRVATRYHTFCWRRSWILCSAAACALILKDSSQVLLSVHMLRLFDGAKSHLSWQDAIQNIAHKLQIPHKQVMLTQCDALLQQEGVHGMYLLQKS